MHTLTLNKSSSNTLIEMDCFWGLVRKYVGVDESCCNESGPFKTLIFIYHYFITSNSITFRQYQIETSRKKTYFMDYQDHLLIKQHTKRNIFAPHHRISTL